MKVKKTGFIFPLLLAAVFLIIGLVVMLWPNNSPVAVSENLEVYKDSGYICFEGKIKNVSDETVTINYILITVSTSGGETQGDTSEIIVLEPGEELDFSEYGWRDYDTPYSVTELQVRIDGKTYTVYESMSFKTIGAVILYILAAVFGIAAISAVLQTKRLQKRYDGIEQTLGQMPNNPVFMTGNYVKAGDTAKTASAFFIGVGVFKVYGSNNQHEFVLNDEGLFVGKPLKKSAFNLADMMFISRNSFKEFVLTTDKKKVLMNHKISGDTITLNLAGNTTLTAEAVAERINAMSSAVSEVANTSANEAPAEEDPFKEI